MNKSYLKAQFALVIRSLWSAFKVFAAFNLIAAVILQVTAPSFLGFFYISPERMMIASAICYATFFYVFFKAYGKNKKVQVLHT